MFGKITWQVSVPTPAAHNMLVSTKFPYWLAQTALPSTVTSAFNNSLERLPPFE